MVSNTVMVCMRNGPLDVVCLEDLMDMGRGCRIHQRLSSSSLKLEMVYHDIPKHDNASEGLFREIKYGTFDLTTSTTLHLLITVCDLTLI